MENKFANKRLEGINIYRDKKDQIIYYDIFTKNGYVITPPKEKTFKTMKNVLVYTALVGIFFYVLFEFSWYITLASMIIVGAFLEWRFRRFLNNCSRIKNFKPEEKNHMADYEQSNGLVIIKAVLYFILVIALVASIILYKDSERTYLALSIAAALVCAFMGCRYISIMISRKRNG